MARWNLGNLPAGFRFCPSDIESISYYLAIKNKDRIDFIPDHDIDFIPVYDINRITPDQLPLDCMITTGRNGELYFFTRRDPNKSRQTRSVGENCSWKSKNSSLIKSCNGQVVGLKTTLEFHIGKGKGSSKTDWRMQEYCQATAKPNKVGEFVLCKIYKLKGDDPEERLHQIERDLRECMNP